MAWKESEFTRNVDLPLDLSRSCRPQMLAAGMRKMQRPKPESTRVDFSFEIQSSNFRDAENMLSKSQPIFWIF